MTKPYDHPDFDDNPAWTLDDMKQAVPAQEFFNTENFKALQTRSCTMRGKQKAPTKIAVHVRLDPEIVDFFKATGKGWQTQMNTVLSDYMKTHKG